MNATARTLAVSACTLVAFATGSALAHDPKPAKGAGLDDMKVTRDKETGQLRAPTREELANLRSQGVTVAPHIVELVRPVTVIEVRADGSAVAKRSLADMDHLMFTRGADGKPVIYHAPKLAPKAPIAVLPKE